MSSDSLFPFGSSDIKAWGFWECFKAGAIAIVNLIQTKLSMCLDSCTPPVSHVWSDADITNTMLIDPAAVYAIFALGNQFQATCPAVSTDALLTEHWTQFAITASHPPGDSSVNDFPFLPISAPAGTPATLECSAGTEG